jgi:hypothetical protein
MEIVSVIGLKKSQNLEVTEHVAINVFKKWKDYNYFFILHIKIEVSV